MINSNSNTVNVKNFIHEKRNTFHGAQKFKKIFLQFSQCLQLNATEP